MSDVMIPKARVWPKPDGTLRFHRYEGARRPDDEAWWRDVLLDPRARAPAVRYLDDPDHRYRLDQQAELIECWCPCGLRRPAIHRDKLIDEIGGNMNIIHVVREWMDCKAKNKVTNHCRALPTRIGPL